MTREEMISKRDEYEYLLRTGEDTEYSWMIKNLYSLFDMSIEVHQNEIPTEIQECSRVVQIKRVLPTEIIKLSHPELMIFEGVYIIAKGIAIPKDILKKAEYYKRGYLKKELLPDGFNYGTLKETGLGYGFAFSNEDEISKYITESHGWEFFNLNN